MLTCKIEINSSFRDVDSGMDQIIEFINKNYILENEGLIFKLNFILRELLINAVEHGNKMIPEKKVVCNIKFLEKGIEIEVIDEGEGFILDDIINDKSNKDVLRLRRRGISILNEMGILLSADKKKVTAKLDSIYSFKEKGDIMINKIINGNKITLQLESDYLVASNTNALAERAKDLVDSQDNFNEIILDMSRVKIIDSMGITFVIGLYKTAVNTGKTYKVVGINSEIERLFEIMHLKEIFAIEVNKS